MSTYTLAPLSDRQQKERSKKRLVSSMLSAGVLAGRLNGMTKRLEDSRTQGANIRGVADSLANTLNALNTNYQNSRAKFDFDAHAELNASARTIIDLCNAWEDSETRKESEEAASSLRELTFEVVGTLHYLTDQL